MLELNFFQEFLIISIKIFVTIIIVGIWYYKHNKQKIENLIFDHYHT